MEEYEIVIKKIKENRGIVKYPIEVPSVSEFVKVEGEPAVGTIACRSIYHIASRLLLIPGKQFGNSKTIVSQDS